VSDPATVLVPPTRLEMQGGYLLIGSGLNDITIVATTGDSVNIKIGTPEGVSLGAVSFGRVRPDGGFEQKVLFQGKLAENTRFQQDIKAQGGEFTIHCHDGQKHYVDGELRDDLSMKVCFVGRYDIVWVPRLVTAEEMPNGLPGSEKPAYQVPEGEWGLLALKFGFESEDREHYADGDMSWADVITEMERRAAPTDVG
jgi:hypothetical protein